MDEWIECNIYIFVYSVVRISTQVWSLVQEYPMCCRATKPVCHSCLACALEPTSYAEPVCNCWARVQLLSPCATTEPVCLEPVLCKREATAMRSPQWRVACCNLRKPACSNKDPAQPPQKQKQPWEKHPLLTSHCPCSRVMDVIRFWLPRVSTPTNGPIARPAFLLGHEGVRHLLALIPVTSMEPTPFFQCWKRKTSLEKHLFSWWRDTLA